MSLFQGASFKATPFPHLVADGIWPDDLLQAVYDEFPEDGWRSFQNPNEYKLEYSTPGPSAGKVFSILGSDETLRELEGLTGIPELSMELVGGGYHLIPPGGRLAVHTDCNRSPATGLYRRLNCLIYLNRDWGDAGGCLELWPRASKMSGSEEPVVIPPEWNRTVVFQTSDRSWHGHPIPANRWRFSIAAYFYSPEPSPDYRGVHDTVWMA